MRALGNEVPQRNCIRGSAILPFCQIIPANDTKSGPESFCIAWRLSHLLYLPGRIGKESRS